jgi:hypothetical protein
MARVRLFQFPLDYVNENNYREWISSEFGRNPDRWHNGVDFYAGNGTPLYPIFDGTIYDWGFDRNVYGNWVIVKHDEASFSYYYHMVNRSEYDTGQPVKKHHIIGYVGETGPVTGPHCHLGVSGHGNFTGFVDPVPYILERYWWDDGQPDPQPLKPNQRTTAGWDVAGRSQADLNPANIALIIPPNTVIDCIWWQYGDGGDSGENRFLLVAYNGVQVYVHIGDVIQSGTDGIPEYEGQIKPPEPEPVKDIEAELDAIDQAVLNIRKITEKE